MTASRSLAEIEKAIQIVEDNLRQLQEQFFSVAEIQLDADHPAGPQFLRDLGFEQVDTGQVYRKVENAS